LDRDASSTKLLYTSSWVSSLPRWVIVVGCTVSVFKQAMHQGQLSLATPPCVGGMSSSDGCGYR